MGQTERAGGADAAERSGFQSAFILEREHCRSVLSGSARERPFLACRVSFGSSTCTLGGEAGEAAPTSCVLRQRPADALSRGVSARTVAGEEVWGAARLPAGALAGPWSAASATERTRSCAAARASASGPARAREERLQGGAPRGRWLSDPSRLENLAAGDKVGLAVHFHKHRLGALDPHADEAFGGGAARLQHVPRRWSQTRCIDKPGRLWHGAEAKGESRSGGPSTPSWRPMPGPASEDLRRRPLRRTVDRCEFSSGGEWNGSPNDGCYRSILRRAGGSASRHGDGLAASRGCSGVHFSGNSSVAAWHRMMTGKVHSGTIRGSCHA